ncbi:Trehalose-phosphatase [Alteripontixanthobacter maritimus]|uniref:Trehalose 6-phosphate phosphatase n=1 Tax=Alteripontixanthobacter maritimus TaxID=2161824 RepID=A0A369QBI2_9SPHN|nr:trehalose-phosphatase [Alteripontixanthobacter maritimus]RDC59608.1 Trehalose-phosphatase [Alteripontixanthobacter maritimus]
MDPRDTSAPETRAQTLPAPPTLAELLLTTPVALFLDFDGTLVEIADTPDTIEVPGELGPRLRLLASRMDGRLAIVSGRSIDDIATHFDSEGLARAGSHGASRFAADGARLGEEPAGLDDDTVQLLTAYADKTGCHLERKSHGAALHFRQVPEAGDAAIAFATELARRKGLDVKTGKAVIELVQRGATKAAAVTAFMATEPFKGATPIFIGDDVTDEDGFRSATAHGGFGILVGNRDGSAARYALPNVPSVHDWLTMWSDAK